MCRLAMVAGCSFVLLPCRLVLFRARAWRACFFGRGNSKRFCCSYSLSQNECFCLPRPPPPTSHHHHHPPPEVTSLKFTPLNGRTDGQTKARKTETRSRNPFVRSPAHVFGICISGEGLLKIRGIIYKRAPNQEEGNCCRDDRERHIEPRRRRFRRVRIRLRVPSKPGLVCSTERLSEYHVGHVARVRALPHR